MYSTISYYQHKSARSNKDEETRTAPELGEGRDSYQWLFSGSSGLLNGIVNRVLPAQMWWHNTQETTSASSAENGAHQGNPLLILTQDLATRIILDITLQCFSRLSSLQEAYRDTRDIVTELYTLHHNQGDLRFKIARLSRILKKNIDKIPDDYHHYILSTIQVLELIGHLADFKNTTGDSYAEYITDIIRRSEEILSLEIVKNTLPADVQDKLHVVSQTARFICMIVKQVQDVAGEMTFDAWLKQAKDNKLLPEVIENTLMQLDTLMHQVRQITGELDALKQRYPWPEKSDLLVRIGWLQAVLQDEEVRARLEQSSPQAFSDALKVMQPVMHLMESYPGEKTFSEQMGWLKTQITSPASALRHSSAILLPADKNPFNDELINALLSLCDAEQPRMPHIKVVMASLFSGKNLTQATQLILSHTVPYSELFFDFWHWYQKQPSGQSWAAFQSALLEDTWSAIKTNPQNMMKIVPANYSMLREAIKGKTWQETFKWGAEKYLEDSQYALFYDVYRKGSAAWALFSALQETKDKVRQRRLLEEVVATLKNYLHVTADSYLYQLMDIIPYLPLMVNLSTEIRAIPHTNDWYEWAGRLVDVLEHHPDAGLEELVQYLKSQATGTISDYVVNTLLPVIPAPVNKNDELLSDKKNDVREAGEITSDATRRKLLLSSQDVEIENSDRLEDEAGGYEETLVSEDEEHHDDVIIEITDDDRAFLQEREISSSHLLKNIGLGIGLGGGLGLLLWGGYAFSQAGRQANKAEPVDESGIELVNVCSETPSVSGQPEEETDELLTVTVDSSSASTARPVAGTSGHSVTNQAARSKYVYPGLLMTAGGVMTALSAWFLYRENITTEDIDLTEEELEELVLFPAEANAFNADKSSKQMISADTGKMAEAEQSSGEGSQQVYNTGRTLLNANSASENNGRHRPKRDTDHLEVIRLEDHRFKNLLYFELYTPEMRNILREKIARITQGMNAISESLLLRELNDYLSSMFVKEIARHESLDYEKIIQYILVMYEISIRNKTLSSTFSLDEIVNRLEGEENNELRLSQFVQSMSISDMSSDPIYLEALRVIFSNTDSVWDEKKSVLASEKNNAQSEINKLQNENKNLNHFIVQGMPATTQAVTEKLRQNARDRIDNWRKDIQNNLSKINELRRKQTDIDAEVLHVYGENTPEREIYYKIKEKAISNNFINKNLSDKLDPIIGLFLKKIKETPLGKKEASFLDKELTVLSAGFELFKSVADGKSSKEIRQVKIEQQLSLQHFEFYQAYQYFLPLIIAQKEKINNYKTKNDYRDILNSSNMAKDIIKNVNSSDAKKYSGIMLEAMIYYAIRNIDVGEDLGGDIISHGGYWKIYKEYMNDTYRLNPLTSFMKSMPPGFFSYRDIKHGNQFASTLAFNEQINQYEKDFSHYDAMLTGKLLFSALSSQLSTNEIITAPVSSGVYSLSGDLGGVAYITLSDNRAVVLAMVNGASSAKIITGKGKNPIEKYLYPHGRPGPVSPLSADRGKRIHAIKDQIQTGYKNVTRELGLTASATGTIEGESVAISGKDFVDVLINCVTKMNDNFASTVKVAWSDESSWNRFLRAAIPFYDIIYKTVTDRQYQVTSADIYGIIVDVVDVMTLFVGAGIALTEALIESIASSAVVKFNAVLTRTHRVLNIINNIHSLATAPLLITSIAENGFIETLSPMLTRMMVMRGVHKVSSKVVGHISSSIIRNHGLLKPEWAAKSVNPEHLELVNNGDYKDTYTKKPAYKKSNQSEYFIKQENKFYRVEFDGYSQQLQIINQSDRQPFAYKVPVKYSETGHWVTHSTVPGLGGEYIPKDHSIFYMKAPESNRSVIPRPFKIGPTRLLGKLNNGEIEISRDNGVTWEKGSELHLLAYRLQNAGGWRLLPDALRNKIVIGEHTFKRVKYSKDKFNEMRRIANTYASKPNSPERIVRLQLNYQSGKEMSHEPVYDRYNNLSLDEKLDLFNKSSTDATTRGVLAGKINESIVDINLYETAKVADAWQASANKATKVILVPQNIFLKGRAGECLPESVLMGWALQSGQDEKLAKKLMDIYSSPNISDNPLYKSLVELHANGNSSRFSAAAISDVKMSTLSEAELNLFPTINSSVRVDIPEHTMLISKVNKEGKVAYVFYDPNYGLAYFDKYKDMSAFFKKKIETYSAPENSIHLCHLDYSHLTEVKIKGKNLNEIINDEIPQ